MTLSLLVPLESNLDLCTRCGDAEADVTLQCGGVCARCACEILGICPDCGDKDDHDPGRCQEPDDANDPATWPR